MIIPRPEFVPERKPERQRGFSLWELTVLLGLLGVAIVAGFALLKSDRAQQIESERTAQLSAADRALAGFIVGNGRLPCPDTTGNGLENCSGSEQKGWLPVVTLGLNSSAPARGVARLSYIVYRGASADLTVLSDRYNPVKYDLTTTYSYNQLNTLDFCAGLTLAAAATPSATSAYIPGAPGVTVNVAYALAESGIDVDGDGNLFDGLNASTTAPVLESPARASDISYDDIVQARGFSDLQDTLRCPQATRSVDAISMAVEVGITVADLKAGNLSNGIQQSINAGISIAMDAASLALTVGSAVAGGVILTEAIAALATNTALCAATLGIDVVACANIGIDVAAIALATAGLVVAASAIVAYGVALPLNIAALAASIIATAKADAAPPTGAMDPAAQQAQLAALQTAVTNAANKASAAEADALAARSAANAALTTYNNSVASVYTVAHGYDAAHSNDPLLAAAVAAYVTYAQAAQAYSVANGYAKAQRLQYNNVFSTIPAAIAERDAAVADALANPTDVKKQALAKAKTDTVINLQTRAANLDAAATLAEQDAANKLAASNSAYASYVTAKNTALNAYSIAFPFQNSRTDISAALDAATNAYDDYLAKDRAATDLESTAVTARKNANDMLNAYNTLAAQIASGSTTGGPAAQAFTGAEAILKAADAKGALQ